MNRKLFTRYKNVFRKVKKETSKNEAPKGSGQLITKDEINEKLEELNLVSMLLEPLSDYKELAIEKFALLNDVRTLQKLCDPFFFKMKNEEDRQQRAKRKECLYELFVLFANPKYAKKEYSREVLDWLARGEKIEEVILQQSGVSMVHKLAMNNNLAGVQWAFQWYHEYKEGEIRALVFDSYDSYQHGIFHYVVDGVLDAIESSNHPEARVVAVVLAEFANTIGDEQERIRQVNEKKMLMKSLLSEDTDLTYELSEQLLVRENELLVKIEK